MDQDALERKLYIIRKKSGHAIQALRLRHGKEFYVTSMSSRTIVYKGMLLAHQVGEYFVDSRDESMISALAMVHQRFSTNTFPTWDLAHPFRMACHNGEINTLRGNVNWIRARQQGIASTVLGRGPRQDLAAHLRRAVGFGVVRQRARASRDGRLLARARDDADDPEAWAGNPLMDEDRRAFYEYHAALMEPWDGPAAMAFTDGRPDRRDARPQRPAPGALHRHRRRLRRDGFGSRRARHSRAQDRHQVAAAARQDAARRHRAGPHHRRRGIEAHARDGEAVPPLDRALAHRARRSSRPRAAAAHGRSAARPASRHSATRRRI
jgi:hypothetical protein